MKYLKVKEVIMDVDNRESNIIQKDLNGNPIKFKQSKCTCRLILENGEEYQFVIKNQDIEKAIKLIAENEDKKYPYGLGRNMFFLAYLYEIYKDYLTKWGFNPPQIDLEKSIIFKRGNYENQER